MAENLNIVGGNAPINRPIVDSWSNYYMIDTNNAISADTRITNFEIFAKRANPVQLIIYRRTGNAFEVVGKSAALTAKLGLNNFQLAEPIEAKQGDLVGFFYASTGTIAFQYDGGASLVNGLGCSVYFTGGGAEDAPFVYSSQRTYSIRVWGLPAVEPKAEVMIHEVFYDGLERRTEGDEYIAISNVGTADADLSGWRIHADDKGQDFTFPKGTTLGPDQGVRVYTNHDDPSTGGFSFGSGRAIWNNKGDKAVLYDQDKNVVDTFEYGSLAPEA